MRRICRSMRAWVGAVSLPLLHLLLVLVPVPSSGAPRPDDSPSDSNSVDMIVLTPRSVAVPSIGGSSSSSGSSSSEGGYHIPVFMAEMNAPVSTRTPSIFVVSCRQGFGQDPAGNCRQAFTPMPYLPPTSRPDRNANIQSILSRIRSPPRPRVVPQTQRDLVRNFNTSRRRPSWFGRSVVDDSGASPNPSSDPGVGGGPMPPRNSGVPTTTTTEAPKTTTPDNDD